MSNQKKEYNVLQLQELLKIENEKFKAALKEAKTFDDVREIHLNIKKLEKN